jgi:hypothetical protein
MTPPRDAAAATFLTSAFLLALAAYAPAARADASTTSTQACVSAYEDGQVLRKDGKLTRARERLLVCAQASCSPVLRKQCTAWVAEVDQQTPTVVLVARGLHGEDVVDVHVTLDGKELTHRLDGRALPLDPGPHAFRFEIDGATARDETVVVNQGEHERRVVADFHVDTPPPPSSPGATHPAPTPVAVPLLGGLAAAGLGTFALFGWMGMSAKDDLDARQCKPACPQTDVDAVKRKFLVADFGLGVGVASLAAATLIYLTKGEITEQSNGAVTVGAAPVPGGAAVGLSGSF